MNRVYRLVFNRELGVMQVASELACAYRGGGGAAPIRRKARRARLAAAVLAACGLFGTAAVRAQSVDYAAIFDDDYVMAPDTAANYDWEQIDVWGMIVGYQDDGHVIVRDGLLVETAGVILGHNAGVSGQMDLIGPGTTLTEGMWTGEPLYVGLAGTGVLNVLQGAKVADLHWLHVAEDAGSEGTINIDGAGSELGHSEWAIIGRYGNGRLNITNGGKVSVGNIDAAGTSIGVGQYASSTGTILVDGAGSLLQVSGNPVRIGDRGTGTLTVSNGGRVDTRALRAGYDTTGVGTIEVAGKDSRLTASSISVGGAGTGDMVIRDGAMVETTVPDLFTGYTLGADKTGKGTLLIEGAGSALAVTGSRILIGYEGEGSMTVRNGASVTTGAVTLGFEGGPSGGYEGGAAGSLIVTGTGTHLAIDETPDGDGIGDLTVGHWGKGSLQILEGATVSTGSATIGYAFDDNGTVDAPSGLQGSALVSGAGSTLKVAGTLAVAEDTTGSLMVEKGASVEAGSVRLEHDDEDHSSDFSGELRITDAGTMFKAGEFDVSTHFSLTDGARLDTGSAQIRRNYTTREGETALISGPQTRWNNTGDLSINASTDFTDGAQVTTGTLTIGPSGHGDPLERGLLTHIRVLGEDTLVTTTGDVNVGLPFSVEAPGLLVLADGGRLQVGADIKFVGYGFLTIGGGLQFGENDAVVHAPAQSAGFLNPEADLVFSKETSSSGLLLNHTEDNYVIANALVSEGYGDPNVYFVYPRITSIAGVTRLTGDASHFSDGIEVQGGRLVLDSDMNVLPGDYDPSLAKQYDIQSVSITGGELLVNGALGFEYQWSSGDNVYTERTSRVDVSGTGVLGGGGTIVGNVEVTKGGHLAPGEDGVGTLTIDGDLTIGENALDVASFFDVDVLGNGQADKLVVTGVANINEGDSPTTVTVTTLDPSTSYQNGMRYTILTANGGVTGTFDQVLSNSAFLAPTLSYDANNVFLGIALDTSKADAVVGNGEVVGGSGTWASIEVQGGGTLSPGDGGTPIGTIGATGPVKFAPGSFYDVDIEGDGSSDRLSTTGAATLEGGTVRVTALDPQTSYQNGQQYTIVSADGGVTGEFAEAISRSAFLTPSLSYDANHVLLKIALKTSSGDGVVDNGEILSGTGSYDSIDVRSGGVVSPGESGNPIGTLSATGPVKFAAGSFYDVDVKGDGSSDRLSTTGAATLEGGAVRVTALDPQTSYQNGQSYTILSAAGGVTGTFTDAISRSAFLDPSLSYGQNEAKLIIALKSGGGDNGGGETPPPIFETVATTRNQHNIARALDTLPQSGDGLALYNKLLLLGAEEARDAYGSLSGELHLATRSALLDDRFLREGIDRRLSGETADTAGEGLTGWVAGSASSGGIAGDGNASRTGYRQEGLMAGVDWALSDTLLLGAALGAADHATRVAAWDSGADVGARHLGVYAQARWDALSVRGGVSHAWYDVDSTRHAAVGSGHVDRLDADYDASATTVFAEAGWDFGLGRTLLTPYVSVAHTRLETDGAGEHGGITALEVAQSKDELLAATAGVRASWAVDGGNGDDARLQAGLAWQNNSGELKPDQRARFVAGGDAFSVYGTPLARNLAVANLGLSLRTSEASQLTMDVQGRFGDGQHDGGAQMQWRWRF